jgi:hypothetical protein
MTSFGRRYSKIAKDEREVFLVRVIFELTLRARDAYSGSPSAAISKLRAMNEVQHRLSAHLMHLLDDRDERYPDGTLWEIVSEIAATGGCDHDLDVAFAAASSAIHAPASGFPVTKSPRRAAV